MNNIKEIEKEIEQIIDDYGAPENITDEIKEFFSGNLDRIIDFIKASDHVVKEITLTAEDIVEITNRMNNEFRKGYQPSQGLLEYLMCKVIRDYKGISFFEEEPIKSPNEKVQSFGDLLRENIIYTKDGKEYRKINRNEIIKEGAMFSWRGGELQPIHSTADDTPANFANEREFYNPL